MFATTLVLVALAAQPATPAESFRKAEELYASDRFGEAEPLYQAALKSDEPNLKRRAYERLLALYMRSGRPDKSIKLAELYRAWLRSVDDAEGVAVLDLRTGECLHELGYAAEAEKYLVAALGAKVLTTEGRLKALRLRAEVAGHRRDGTEKDRWTELEKAATEAVNRATAANALADRIVAGRYLAESLFQRGDITGALAALAEFPELHDRLEDPLGRRDTQLHRAKFYAAKGDYPAAAPLFKEALELHRKHQPKRRLIAGDILAEWSVAAAKQRATARRGDAVALRDEAVKEYREALAAPADDPNSGGALAAVVRLQAVTRSARQFQQALDVTVTAGERWSNDPLVDGRLKSDRGGLELMTAAYRTARTSLEKARADYEAADPPNLRALPKVLINLATAELALESPEKADQLLARCAELYARHKLAPDAVRVECDYLSGVGATRRGEYAQAMAHFRAGLTRCDTVGRTADQVRFNLHLNVALLHKEQGDPPAAEEELKKASAVLAGFPEPDDLLAALLDAVRIDLFLAREPVELTQAMALAPKLKATCDKYGYKSGYLWATERHIRALEKFAHDDFKGAEAIWRELADVQRKEQHILLPRALNYLGACADQRGNSDEAIELFKEARTFQATRPRCPPVTHAITLTLLARALDRKGEKAEAKTLLNQVFEVADRARLNTFGGAAQRATVFAQFASAFDLLAALYAREKDGDGLLRTAVRSRSRTLLDQMLAAGADPRDRLTGETGAALLKREADARRAVSRLRARAMLIPANAGDEPDSKKVLTELEAAQKEYTDVWREIANVDPLTRVLANPAFGETALVQVRQEAHRTGGVLLTYVIGRRESFAVLSTDPTKPPQVFNLRIAQSVSDIGDAPAGEVIARAGFRGVTIKPTGKQPDRPVAGPVKLVPLTDLITVRLADQYLRNVADPSFSPTRGINIVARKPGVTNPAAPEVFGDAVLPPELLAKIRGAKRLVLIPDSALHKLPFECLLVSGTPGPKYALDELPPVCYAPSIAALAVVLGRPAPDGPASLLTVGDPAYPEAGADSLPRLPYTLVESKRVRQSFAANQVTALEGAAATESQVAASLSGKRFVHLAAHGFADRAFGNAFAAIALTPPPKGSEEPGNDGFLTLHEITRLKLTGCELTVLSACVTNVGPQSPMEAGVTLAGAFLGAGSRGVMASCWSVDDRATAELMSTFFTAIRPANGKGMSHAEALKAARVAVRSKPGWEAPFFWAPFVYVGPPE